MARSRAMSNSGKYIYGIVEEKRAMRFDVAGMGGSWDRPYTIVHKAYGAVVSDAPIQVYENSPENLLAHNRVLEALMKDYDIFPMRFGTVAQTQTQVVDLLAMLEDSLAQAIASQRGKVEYTLEVDVQDAKLLSVVQEQSPVIRQIKAMSAGKVITMEDKIKIGKVVAQEIMKEKLRIAAFIKNSFSFGIDKLISLPLPRSQTLLNLAFLFKKEHGATFENLVHEIDRKLDNLVHFKITGPLPPYHFSELNLLVIDFAAVDQARRALGLPQEVTTSDIKKAYRDLAMKFHPDHAQGQAEADAMFRQMDQAYKLLWRYCQHNPKPLYRFRPEDFPQTILLLDRDGRNERTADV